MMLEFRCKDCGSIITVPADVRDRPIVCYNCNSRQPIPVSANSVQDAGLISFGSRVGKAPAELPDPPSYFLVQFGGGLSIFIGVLYCIGSIFVAIQEHQLDLFLGVINGFLLAAGGALMLLFRDIAIELWLIRQRIRR